MSRKITRAWMSMLPPIRIAIPTLASIAYYTTKVADINEPPGPTKNTQQSQTPVYPERWGSTGCLVEPPKTQCSNQPLFDYLVGAGEQRRRHGEVERLG